MATPEFYDTAQTVPEFDAWVLAYWPHMYQPWDRQRACKRKHFGWYPARRRRERGWQTQFSGSYRSYVVGVPPLWTPILPPLEEEPVQRGGLLEQIMHARYGGTRIDCPKCGAARVKFHKLRSRRVYACPECRFQIAPTANTILHDTRTPLSAWELAALLLQYDPKMTGRELAASLGVTYKCAWRIARKIRGCSAREIRRQTAQGMPRKAPRPKGSGASAPASPVAESDAP